jgi:hypothetical protein
MTRKDFHELGKSLANEWGFGNPPAVLDAEKQTVCLLAYIARLLEPINAHYEREDKKRRDKERKARDARRAAAEKLTRGPKNPPLPDTIKRMLEWEMGYNAARKRRPVKLPSVEEMRGWDGFGKACCGIYEKWLKANGIVVEP